MPRLSHLRILQALRQDGRHMRRLQGREGKTQSQKTEISRWHAEMTKPLSELLHLEDSAWPKIKDWISTAQNHVELLPPTEQNRNDAILQLQMPLSTNMGAVVYECGGIFIDHGWIRVFGSGHERISRSLPQWTFEVAKADNQTLPFVLVGDDVIGGFFAFDCGGLGSTGKVFYFAPDTFEWENMGLNYAEFLYGHCLNGNVGNYYQPYRWENWQADVAHLSGDEAYSIMPPLCVKSVVRSQRNNIWSGRSRRAISSNELYASSMDMSQQMADVPNGKTVVFKVLD